MQTGVRGFLVGVYAAREQSVSQGLVPKGERTDERRMFNMCLSPCGIRLERGVGLKARSQWQTLRELVSHTSNRLYNILLPPAHHKGWMRMRTKKYFSVRTFVFLQRQKKQKTKYYF